MVHAVGVRCQVLVGERMVRRTHDPLGPPGAGLHAGRGCGRRACHSASQLVPCGWPVRRAEAQIRQGPPGQGKNPQVSQAGNAGKPDNEDEYRHRVRARATASGRLQANSSFQFHGTLSRCRSGTAAPPSHVCHAALVRGGYEPPTPPDWRLPYVDAAASPATPSRWPSLGTGPPPAGGASGPVHHRGAGRARRRPDPAGGGLRRRPGWWRGGVRDPGQPGVEERSISARRAVRPSSSPALSTLPDHCRASPHARARRASRRAFQRQLS